MHLVDTGIADDRLGARARTKSIIRDPGVYEVHPFRDRRPQDYRICAAPAALGLEA